jgi:hypothetical protein
VRSAILDSAVRPVVIVILDPTSDRGPRFFQVAIFRRPDFLFLQAAMEPFDVAVVLRVMIRRAPMCDRNRVGVRRRSRGALVFRRQERRWSRRLGLLDRVRQEDMNTRIGLFRRNIDDSMARITRGLAFGGMKRSELSQASRGILRPSKGGATRSELNCRPLTGSIAVLLLNDLRNSL